MFSDSPGTLGPQAAEAADDQFDLHAGLGCIVQRGDDLGSCRAFILAMMRAGRPALACSISRRILLRNRSRMFTGATSNLR